MFKNVSGQKWRVFAYNRTTGAPVTGDAANITGKISKDHGAATAIGDTNPTEIEDGYYDFDLTQAETNADVLHILPESSTSLVQVIGVPGCFSTLPAGFTALTTAAIEAAVGAGGNIDGFTRDQSLKVILAEAAGKTEDMETSTGKHYAADDSKVRITSTLDGDNRVNTTIDAT